MELTCTGPGTPKRRRWVSHYRSTTLHKRMLGGGSGPLIGNTIRQRVPAN
jgi:hypothetical protein